MRRVRHFVPTPADGVDLVGGGMYGDTRPADTLVADQAGIARSQVDTDQVTLVVGSQFDLQ